MHERSSTQGDTPPLILFATPPPLDQLRALTVNIPNTVPTASRFQPQVIKCREFIFTEPEVIGTPSADINDHSFHLVTNVSLIQSGKIQNRLSRIGLQVSSPYSVSTELYQACLQYTITARLSPAWNKAGPWLIQGRDFLTQKGCSNAVRMDLTVVNNELYFTLVATALKQGPLQVTDLDILGRQLERYFTNTDVSIEHDHIASDWCYILPSMKRGRIWSISHHLPEESPFTSYKDIKRHWKNTYGYRLPETDEGLHFYQINFGPFGGKLFNYPEVCLRPREMQRMSRIDPKPILRSFVLEIQSKFPTVCGHPIKLQSKAKFTVNELLSINQFHFKVDRDTHANLSHKMKNSRPAVYRSKAEMGQLLAQQSSLSTPNIQTAQNPKPLIQILSLTPGPSTTNMSSIIETPNLKPIPSSTPGYAGAILSSTSKTPNRIFQDLPNRKSMTKGTETPMSFESMSFQVPGTRQLQSDTARQLFPSFKPMKPAAGPQPMVCSQPATRMVPSFSSNKSAAQAQASKPSSASGQREPNGSMQSVNGNQSHSSVSTGKVLPLFHKHSKPVLTAPSTKSTSTTCKPKSAVTKDAGTSKRKPPSKRKKDGKKPEPEEPKKMKLLRPED
ncbi:uncharacterized protein C18orf63-like isoform X2 [Dreissena polymorpha]|uniref:uncharacterized protein C18orf63-like isoform X2 n=1 Tax=Dreissena polymorpha TaxID=45954 RepID=UPI002264D2CC|nr:uncharacterized protein C18orf63-like isoform X2 [Dreissena polymorpha]